MSSQRRTKKPAAFSDVRHTQQQQRTSLPPAAAPPAPPLRPPLRSPGHSRSHVHTVLAQSVRVALAAKPHSLARHVMGLSPLPLSAKCTSQY